VQFAATQTLDDQSGFNTKALTNANITELKLNKSIKLQRVHFKQPQANSFKNASKLLGGEL